MKKTFKMAPWCAAVKVFTCFVGGLAWGSLIYSLALPIGSWTWEWLVVWGMALFLLIIAPWNATAKVLAYFGGSVLVSGSVLLAGADLFTHHHSYRGFFDWVIYLGVWMIMPLVYIFAPLGCVADTKRLLIKRAMGPIVIPYEQILSVEVKEKVEFYPIKVWAVSGVFAFYGTFIVKGDDMVKAYVTDFNVPMVRVKTARRIYYLTPVEPDDFVKTVKQYLA